MKSKTIYVMRTLAAIAVLVVMASSCGDRSIQKKINGAVADLQNVTVTTDDHTSRIVDCIYGFGSRFVMLDAVTQERIQAMGHLGGAAAIGFALEDAYGPYFAPAEEDKPGAHYRDQYLSMIIDSGADINTGFVVPSGEERTVDRFVRRSIAILDPAQIAYQTEPVEGINGNQIGWTLMMLADIDMASAEWMLHDKRKTGTADFVSIAMNRPRNWGAYSGMIEQQGIAAVYRSYKMNSMIEETSYYEAQKKENKGKAGKPPLYDTVTVTGFWLDVEKHVKETLDLLEKNRSDDGTFSRNWSESKKPEDKALDVILYTSLALEIINEAASDKELTAPWIKTSVVRLANLVRENRFEIHDNSFVMSHAARALRNYRNRLKKRSNPVSVESDIGTVETYDDYKKKQREAETQ